MTTKAPLGLTLRLSHPGLTPVMRAGLGGLASTLHTLELEGVRLPGRWEIEPTQVHLDWSDSDPSTFIESLFAQSFRLRDGVIDLPGAYGPTPPSLEVRSKLQDALRRTFLQHGKMARKGGAATTRGFELDGKQHMVLVQPYASYTPQDQAGLVVQALQGKPAELAGWANPGAVQRHVAFGSTKMKYGPEAALCACFGLVGCVSLTSPVGGVLLVPEPVDLSQFARLRPKLTPDSLRGVAVGGVGDAVLGAEVAIRAERLLAAAVGGVSAMHLQTTAWASQQKSRVDVLRSARHTPEVVDRYRDLVSLLPPSVVDVQPKKSHPGDVFLAPSSFRAFVADNLARGHRWYRGFADARDLRERQRFLHLARRKDNLGALRRTEIQGVEQMTQHLDQAERVLVRSVQTAIRRRFGVIASENQENKTARENRWSRERERWRMAFAGAKTKEQLRFALADLWSRAGHVPELVDGWEILLPLLREDWQAARDLALVGLAAYGASGSDSQSTPSSL